MKYTARLLSTFFFLVSLSVYAASEARNTSYDLLEFFRSGEELLLVDTTNSVVYLKAQATELLLGEPIEFILIHEISGHGYESAAKTEVLPSALHRALRSIGLTAGKNADHEAYRFWPEGDRVGIRIHWLDPETKTNRSHSAEELVELVEEKKLTTGGWLFTGSNSVEPEEGKVLYGADVVEPSSLISLFNTEYTVLDLPDRNPQDSVYGQRLSRPGFHLPEKYPMVITLEPLYEKPRHTAAHCIFRWASTEGGLTVMVDLQKGEAVELDAADLVLWLRDAKAEGLDPYVKLYLDSDLALEQLHGIANLMHKLESPQGLRILPPPENHFFFRAFMPPEAYRERKKRPSQPLEYYMDKQLVTVLEEDWTEVGQTISGSDIVLSETNSLAKVVASMEELSPTLFVYAQATTTRKQLHVALDPVASFFPIIYIFMEKAE